MFVFEFFRRMLATRRLRVCGLALCAGLVFSGFASEAEGKNPFHTRGGRALEGYDAVAYFTQARAVRGSPSHKARWGGVEWLFSSAENREIFLGSPERYAPQFGGYCAYGVAQGYTVRGDPKQWSVYRERLYVNYNANVKRQWAAKKESYIMQARGRWPAVLQ